MKKKHSSPPITTGLSNHQLATCSQWSAVQLQNAYVSWDCHQEKVYLCYENEFRQAHADGLTVTTTG